MIRRGIYKQLAEIGKIKIGMKGEERTSKAGKKFRIPMKLDHFIITTTERDKNGDYIINNDLMEKLPPQPKELDVMLLFDDIDLNFHTEYQYYHGNRRLCHGDGILAERTYLKDSEEKESIPGHIVDMYKAGDHDTVFDLRYEKKEKVKMKAGESGFVICDPERCPFAQPDDKGATRCKPSGILSVILPESMEIGGVYRFRTHSWHAVSSILSSLELISNMTGGVLAGLPMKMKLLKKSTEDHGTVYYVTIVFDGAAHKMRETAALEMQQRNALPSNNVRMIEEAARSKPDFFATDEEEDIADEFYASVPEEEIPIDSRAEKVLGAVRKSNPEPALETEPVEEEKEEVEEEKAKKNSIDDELF